MGVFDDMLVELREANAINQEIKSILGKATSGSSSNPDDANTTFIFGGNGAAGNGGRATNSGDQTRRPDSHNPEAPYRAKAGITKLRRNAAGWVNQRWGAGHDHAEVRPAFDEDGKLVGHDIIAPGDDGVGTHHPLINGAQSHVVTQQLRANNRAPKIASIANTVGQQGLQKGLSKLAVEVPEIGMAIAAAETIWKGTGLIVNERQKNAQYQNIFGGGNFSTGYENRMQQAGFGIGQRMSGGLTGAESKKLFLGVSEMGYGNEGGRRQKALNFASAMYKGTGQSVDDSLAQLGEMAKTGATDFHALKASLELTAAAARKAGVGIDMANKAYQNFLDQNAGASMTGENAAILSGAETKTQLSVGRGVGSVINTGGAAGGSMKNDAMMAGALGMSVNQFIGQAYSNPTLRAEGLDKVSDQMLGGFMTPQLKDWIKNNISEKDQKKIKGGKKNDEMLLSYAAAAISAGVVNPQAAVAVLSAIDSVKNASDDQKDVAAVGYIIWWAISNDGSKLGPNQTSAIKEKVKTDREKSLSKKKGFLHDTMNMVSTMGLDAPYHAITGHHLATANLANSIVDNTVGRLLTVDSHSGDKHAENLAVASAQLKAGQQQSNNGPMTLTVMPNQSLNGLLVFDGNNNVNVANQGAANGLPPSPASGKKGN